MNSVTVYTTPTCPWCMKAKEFLRENKIHFKEVDVSKSEKGREEMIKKSDQMGVPVLDIDGEIIIGFDEEAIELALTKEKSTPKKNKKKNVKKK